jgi:hypothetical protein
MRIHSVRIDVNTSESLAIEALSFLVENPEGLARFLALTGVDPADLREIARGRTFLGAVLEHVASDQDLLAAFAAHAGRDPAMIDQARILLTGGDWERDTA